MTHAVAKAARTLRLGTRKSPLALAQSRQVARALAAAHDDLDVELVPIVTEGDRLPGDLAALGGKGLFTEELERGLRAGELDLAVHSLKDLPVDPGDDLAIAAFPRRADPRDVLVSELAGDLEGLAPGAVVLTGALRRRAQVLAHRPDLVVEPLRGNVGTRLKRWRERGAAGVILAAAGLARLGLDEKGELPIHPLDPRLMVPAPGQGVLAVQVRAGSDAEALVRVLDHPPTAAAAAAERRLVAALGGSCTLPLGAWASYPSTAAVGAEADEEDAELRLLAVLALPDGSRLARGEAAGASPEAVADACLDALRRDGAEAILAAL